MAESFSFGTWGATCEEVLQSGFPLHRACRDGDLEKLRSLLLQAQHGIYEEDGYYGWTPAHWAAYFGKLACLRKLMMTTRVGVNCNIRSSRFCQTPAHLAAFGGHPQCLHWLLQAGAEADLQDYLGETAVHKAGRTGSMECISLLISHGARLYITNNNGQTPAEVAAVCGFEECAKYLAQAAKKQEGDAHKGVYNNVTSHAQAPHPTDITVQQNVHPCVIYQGLNGGKLPPKAFQHNSLPSEQEMEEDVPASEKLTFGDVTLHTGISSNLATVGGRKRCREEVEELDHKRIRTEGPSVGNLHNNFAQHHHNNQLYHLTQQMGMFQNLPLKTSAMEEDLRNDFKPGLNHKMKKNTFHSLGKSEQGLCMDSTDGQREVGMGHEVVVECFNTSSVEHASTMAQQQGYDSMVTDAVNFYSGF